MKIVIIEDESIAVQRLEKLLIKNNIEYNLLSQPDSIKTAVDFFKNNKEKIDVVFMDINLSDGLSFEILKKVDIDAFIIFITAYDEYALKAFELNSIDYLLKPIKEQDLQRALNKIKLFTKDTSDNYKFNKSIPDKISKQSRIVVRYGSVIKAIDIKESAYFYTSNKVTFMVLKNGDSLPIDETLDEIESIVDSKEYFRINRQYIISFSSIENMIAYSKSRVKLILNPPCSEETIVSTERSSEFKKWLLGND